MKNMIKEAHDIKYYTGLHPKMKAHYKENKRPTEFGNKIWATSLVLIKYLKENQDQYKGLRVLEVGCGWGLIGVYLAKHLGCDVVCSDLDPLVLPIVEMHAQLNETSLSIKKASFNDFTLDYLKGFDLIIGAEICYSDEITLDIIELIKRSFQVNIKSFIIADPGRPDFEDCIMYCQSNHETKLIDLSGSINTKVTKLLIASR
ncbi:MAG: putative nicotinamide N-methyase [Thermoproteota archaeon]|jgi:predicted nicotinamide N-methyase